MANKVNGNLNGIRAAVIERIRALYDLRMGLKEYASHELIAAMSELTGEIGREISVYIARDGHIADVSVGSDSKVDLPNMRLVRNEDRLCGVRCLHTHPNGDGRLSGVIRICTDSQILSRQPDLCERFFSGKRAHSRKRVARFQEIQGRGAMRILSRNS